MAIRITPDTVRLNYLGDPQTVTVYSDEDDWVVDDESEVAWWAHVPTPGEGQADETYEVTVSADENETTEERSTRIGFHPRGREEDYSWLTVEQDGAEPAPVEPYLTIDPDARTVEADDLSTHISGVDSSDDTCEVDGDTVPDWLSVRAIMQPSVSTFELTYECLTANDTHVPRTAAVRLYNGDGAEATLTVTQLGQDVPEGWKVAHWGRFPDIRGRVWECDILRRTDGEVEPTELAFPADQPLVIEWPSINFEDTVWGSSATLKVVSPGDRTYIDLYTIEPGTIRLDVYRDGELRWSGMLDPEFYEEPYERLSGYEVGLTFTDFGLLDRLKYDLTWDVAVIDAVTRAVELSGIGCDGVDSTSLVALCGASSDRNPFVATGIGVQSENFTDEEGEVSTWREALEGMLQPLGVRMVQRGGTVWLFDTLGVMMAGGEEEVAWSSDSQTLGVDSVYNSVTVTFSPYATDEPCDGEFDFPGDYSADLINTTEPTAGSYQTFWEDYGNDHTNGYDFTVFVATSRSLSGCTIYGSVFHILPIYGSADECTGVMRWMVTGAAPISGAVEHGHYGITVTPSTGQANDIITLPRFRVMGMGSSERSNWMLRLAVEALIDCRYNPFTDASSNNESGNQSTLTSNSASLFIAARVELYDAPEGGTCLWHYDNTAALKSGSGHSLNRSTEDNWVSDAADNISCWLQWYDPDDMTDNGGAVGGWKGNRHTVGTGTSNSSGVSAQLRKADDGEYIPMPPAGGWLEVTITDRAAGFRYNGNARDPETEDGWDGAGIYDTLRWWLYRGAGVSLVRNSLLFDDLDLDDVEYSGTLNAAAQDDLSIDTVCGTADNLPPTARGAYVDMGSGVSFGSMRRPASRYEGSVTARLEDLLIGSLYSQYAGRKTVLTGEAETPGALLLTEQNQEGRVFLLTADTQDVRMGTSDIEMREIGTDTYTSE